MYVLILYITTIVLLLHTTLTNNATNTNTTNTYSRVLKLSSDQKTYQHIKFPTFSLKTISITITL